MESKGRRGDALRRRVGLKINVFYCEEVVIVFALAIGKWAIAGNCSVLASQGFLATEKVGEALCGHETAQEQGEEARGDLHGGLMRMMRRVGLMLRS